MDTQQWLTLLSQLGVGGAVLLVIVKMIVPSINAVAAAIDKMAQAIGRLTERVAHIEGRLDQRDETPPPVPIAAGTGDAHEPVNVRPIRGR